MSGPIGTASIGIRYAIKPCSLPVMYCFCVMGVVSSRSSVPSSRSRLMAVAAMLIPTSVITASSPQTVVTSAKRKSLGDENPPAA